MNLQKATIKSYKALDRFPSLASLRTEHSLLLQRYRNSDIAGLMSEIEVFIGYGKATGTLLDRDTDRIDAQALLDYWSSILYRECNKQFDSTLDEFDPLIAPKLEDHQCPYCGLESFQEHNFRFFHGRHKLLAEITETVNQKHILFVVGPSGSGKSSVVLGGLIPKLKKGELSNSENWHYFPSITPGSHPLKNLSRLFCNTRNETSEWIEKHTKNFKKNNNYLSRLISEASPDSPAILVIDQFEELFTLCIDDDIRKAFINNLIHLPQSFNTEYRVIITLRTDFESHIAKVDQLKTIFEQNHIRVMALDASELREAIEKPAELVGLKFEEGVIDSLISDLLGEPAALPLLQFALFQLWQHRKRNRVTMESYQQLGGARLALANSADRLYRELIPEEQITLKRILLQMLRPTLGLEVMSNRILKKSLYSSGEADDRIDRVLNKLIEGRLIRLTENATFNDTQIEVSHEALIRNWPRLVEWLEKERLNRRSRLSLADAAEQWQSRNRDRSILLRGSLLEEAKQYQDLNENEKKFVRISEREKNRKTRIRFSLVLLAMVLLSGLTAFALWQANIAQTELNRTKKQREIEKRLTSQRDEELIKAQNARKQAKEEEKKARIAEKRAREEEAKAKEEEKKAREAAKEFEGEAKRARTELHDVRGKVEEIIKDVAKLKNELEIKSQPQSEAKILSIDNTLASLGKVNQQIKDAEITFRRCFQSSKLDNTPTPRVQSNAKVISSPGSGELKNLRDNPGTKNPVICKVKVGDAVAILREKKDDYGYPWYEIEHEKSGKRGWIAAQLVNDNLNAQ